MTVEQIYSIMNDVTNELIGKTGVVNEDLSNIVDVGTELFSASSVDNYVKSLVNKVGKVIFVNRPYSGSVPSVLMDAWEYGSVLQKITAEMPEASENESWELEDGHEYKQDIFYKPTISNKFFNSKVTFEIPMSFTERQVKESFNSASELNGFISMIHNAIDKSMTVKVDSLVMRTINNMIAETINEDYGSNTLSSSSGVKAVNLLYLYNEKFGTSLTADKAINNPEFIRFASFTMSLYIDRMSKISTLFNVGGKDRFTSKDKLSVVMLSDFKAGADIYLQSDTYHDKYTSLPNAETVPYWQGSGVNYDFSSVSKINVKTANNHTIESSGILSIMFDRDALGVSNLDRSVTTSYNAKAEFFNNFYKFDAGYFNDFNENFVVFFVA